MPGSVGTDSTERTTPTMATAATVTVGPDNEKVVTQYDTEAGGPVVVAIDEPPDGGLAAWMTVAGAFLVMFVQFGFSECPSSCILGVTNRRSKLVRRVPGILRGALPLGVHIE